MINKRQWYSTLSTFLPKQALCGLLSNRCLRSRKPFFFFFGGFLFFFKWNEVYLLSGQWQMLTDASKWPSRWWRWTEMRWPGSSGSSSKRRWNTGGINHTGAGAGLRRGRARGCLASLFLNRSRARGCERWDMWKIIRAWCGGGISDDVSSSHWLLGPQRAESTLAQWEKMWMSVRLWTFVVTTDKLITLKFSECVFFIFRLSGEQSLLIWPR